MLLIYPLEEAGAYMEVNEVQMLFAVSSNSARSRSLRLDR